jgi:segregation and condensation protein A
MPPSPFAATVASTAGSGSEQLVGASESFLVALDNFSGPFDLLLSLIAKHQLEVTEIALAVVTDEFMAYIARRGDQWPISEASEFLVVAATLLDLKAASLLPSGLGESEDLELLEARDLLFARLLEYRAFKRMAALLAARMAEEAKRQPRAVPLEEPLTHLLPDLIWVVGPAQMAAIARSVLGRSSLPNQMPLEHLHAPAVSVRQQLSAVAQHLAAVGRATFRALTIDAGSVMAVVVARFIALLELYRMGQVTFDQATPLAELTITWTGHATDFEISQEYR